MLSFDKAKALVQEKSGKKLIAFSAVAFVLIAVIVFSAVFKRCMNTQMKLMDEYLWETQKTARSRESELKLIRKAYEKDVQGRAGIGLRLYRDGNTLPEGERLAWIRDTVSAASVSLLDGQGKVLSTTGPASPEDVFSASVGTLVPGEVHLAFFPAASDEAEGKQDGMAFVRLALPEDGEQSLVFEFTCESVTKLTAAAEDWSGVLEKTLVRNNLTAYVKVGDTLTGYAAEERTADEQAQLREQLMAVFRSNESDQNPERKWSGRIISLMGRRYLTAMAHFSREEQGDADVLMMAPYEKVVGNGIFIALAISAIIGMGIVLVQHYSYRQVHRKKKQKGEEQFSRMRVLQATWPGILAVLTVTIVFINMLLLLESRTNTAAITQIKRELVAREIAWNKSQAETVRGYYEQQYRLSAKVMAAYLEKHPEEQTTEGLENLRSDAGAAYLMRFDASGKELAASNSYTGFLADKNLGPEFQALLLGYPSAFSGPSEDPYTGRMQLGAASLMKDAEGRPDGFLLAVYDAGVLHEALEKLNDVSTINGFAVREGHIAAAVSDEDGRFIAHTDPQMIGQKAADYLDDYEPGSSFEGFADYKGEKMCVSAVSAEGKTLMFMTPERMDADARNIALLLSLSMLLLLVLLFVTAQAMTEVEEKLPESFRAGAPILIFSKGYSFFLTVFALFALIASANGWWTTFDYVFSGKWSRGVHLYSLWAALFMLAVTLVCVVLLRWMLRHSESRFTTGGRTIARLVGSLVSYAATIFLFFAILSLFGVNTTALVASAGIISIAVGMGAQSMAADLLAGVFMMLEGSIHVGDTVNAGGVSGRVLDMGIRSTTIEDENGDIIVLNNSKISPVRNKSAKQQKQNKGEKKTD